MKYKINDIGQIVCGGTPSTSVKEYWDNEIVWLTPKDLSINKSKYTTQSSVMISQKGYQNSSAKLVPINTVLMSSRAPIGYLTIAKTELCTNQGFKAIICNEKIINHEFLYYLLQTKVEDLKTISTGSTFLELSTNTFKNYEIEVPDLQEQQHIVNILGSIDDKIENNEELINNYNSLMGYNVVAGMNNEYLPLKEMCSVITKGTTPTTLGKKFVTSGINFIKAESILENHIIDGYKLSFIDEETHNLLKRSQIQEYDILLSIAGTIGRFSFASKEYFPANTNQAVAIIRPKNLINFIHIYSYFCSNLQNIYFNEQTVQGVQANISLSTVSNTPIPQFTNDKILQENLIIFNKLLNAVNENKKLNKLKQLYLKKFFG